MTRRPALLAAALLAAAAALSGCTPAVAARPAAAPASSSATPSASPSTSVDPAVGIVQRMTVRQRAGEVLMTAGTVDELRGLAPVVRRYALAGLMVRGRSAAGTAAVHAAFAPARAAAPAGLPLLTATDQEGGLVQVLSGPGFETMPSAQLQAASTPAALRVDARRWGAALHRAGVLLDLAPVADVPCAADREDNPPVADLRRNYGDSPSAAGRHVAAFIRGMRDAGVATTVKHFPGLGCVRANTDTAADVVDSSTSAASARLRAFADGIAARPGFVMVSSASYSRIDRGVPALFSKRVIGGLLRDRMGFGGVVMSDDVGGAAAVRAWTPAQRAVKFVSAGGDLLLDIVPADVPAMSKALVAKAKADPAFASKLSSAAVRVVTARRALR